MSPRPLRFQASGPRSRVAVAAARAVSESSRLWGQKGLGTIFLKLNGLRAFRGTECTVEFAPGCMFKLPVFEAYWGPTVIGGRPYEPEVVNVLRGLADLDAVFVDGGANWGYYSVLVTSPELGYPTGVAIEANPTTFARLRENARLNADRFTCLPFALGARSGETVVMADTQHHAVAHVRAASADAGADDGMVKVETLTLDDAIRRAGLADRSRFVVKIDVEGQEIPTIEGARWLRAEKDVVFVYEDFKSTDFRTTASLFASEMPIYYVRTDGGCVSVPNQAAVLDVIAADGRVERPVNLVAPKRGGAFHERLESWTRR